MNSSFAGQTLQQQATQSRAAQARPKAVRTKPRHARSRATQTCALQGPLVVHAAKASKVAAKTAKGAAKNIKKATAGARKQAKTTSTDQWYGPDRAQFLGEFRARGSRP